MSLPHYYSSLPPFLDTFKRGTPILTYHHVGEPRRGARIKGLYVSAKLFARQMQQLAEAGFNIGNFDNDNPRVSQNRQPRVFITFDDGFLDVYENALPILKKRSFCAIQFLVSDRIGKTNEWQQHAGDITEPLMNEAQVREWLAAGHQIGAHTRTHPYLTRLSSEAAVDEISGSKKALEDKFGVPIEHFCYPYGDFNERVRDQVAGAGLKTACTTLPGINDASTGAFELKRFTARYPSRSLKAIWQRLKG